MYKRNAQGWSKHLDFILIDIVMMHIALIIASLIRHQTLPYTSSIYRTLSLVMSVVDVTVCIMVNIMHNVLSRGYLKELKATLKLCIINLLVSALYMFALQNGITYSRAVLLMTFVFHIVLGYGSRIIWKKIINNRKSAATKRGTMIAVLNPDTADEMMKRLLNTNADGYQIIGVIFVSYCFRKDVLGYPVVADISDAADYICREWIDAVYVDCPATEPAIAKLLQDCRQMAVPVHYHVPNLSQNGGKQFVERIAGTTVLTAAINYATPTQAIAKRAMDIAGGLVGSIFALLIMAVVGPIIKAKSPGPILYTQERIGRNGKKFRIKKIRSMYVDADERKAELMEQNRVKDGMMFKLDWDPRIIGNEILPDGTRKTGIGEFIRKTSLDEFPQFFNVLAGQMSLVGTRPPTPDEWEKYKYHHRARLACKPGITGMWQVSGRSEITDFEEVVKLDTEYITNWSMGLDVKILFKTFGAVIRRKGAM